VTRFPELDLHAGRSNDMTDPSFASDDFLEIKASPMGVISEEREINNYCAGSMQYPVVITQIPYYPDSIEAIGICFQLRGILN
jgi:hypothetical protein